MTDDELHRVMIFRNDHARVLEAACWSCGKSETYCDGLQASSLDLCCCDDCYEAEHDAHTGR